MQPQGSNAILIRVELTDFELCAGNRANLCSSELCMKGNKW